MAEPDKTHLRPIQYWWLWVFDAVLVSAGMLFVLALQYGTYEFFGAACLMALLPMIPALVLVGGAGSTLFALTKVMSEKRGWSRPKTVVWLIIPTLAVTLLLGLVGATWSPGHRLNYICLGNAPTTAGQVRIAGYSTFLHAEWLAAFIVEPKDFQAMAGKMKLAPVDSFEFQHMMAGSEVKRSGAFHDLPPLDHAEFFKRAFNESEEHQRGSVYAAYDPVTATAVVVREYRD